VEGLTDIVAAACRGFDGLQAAILFGSALTSASPGDVDLALLWRESLTPAERWKLANEIAGEVEHGLAPRGLNVDVKDLRALPLVLQHRVLQTGVIAYVADRRALVHFSSVIVPQALDFLPFHRRALRASAQQLAKKRVAS
jgi:predicted nucleotidyltransferase